jgi:hypothetical protein
MDDNKYRTIIIKPILWKLGIIVSFSAPFIYVIPLFIQLLIWPDIEIQIDIVAIILFIITLLGSVLLQIYILPVAPLLFSKIYSSEISLGFSKRYDILFN